MEQSHEDTVIKAHVMRLKASGFVRAKLQRAEADHAPLVVEPPLEVPQPAAPEVVGALAEEGR